MKKIILAALFAGCITTAYAGLDEGLAAYSANNFPLAFTEFSSLAEQGNVDAQYNLGNMHYRGEGGPQDYTKAKGWYYKAAVQGHTKAQRALGMMYFDGKGVPQDYTQAAQWLRKSAEQGDAIAKVQLGYMHAQGRGVSKNLVVGYALINLSAADADNPMGASIRNTISEMMTPKQIEAGQRLTTEIAKPNNLNKAIAAYLKK